MKVLICGAGIAGLSLANQMAGLGAHVVVLERSPGPRAQGYMIDFFGPGYDAAEAMGLLPAIENVAYRIEEAILLDEHGHRRARVSPELFAGGQLLDVTRVDLERVLRESLPHTVELRYGAAPVDVIDDGDTVRVVIDDGTLLEADLLVGADGLHSTVRRLVFGAERRFLRYLGFHTAAFIFDSPTIHEAVTGRAFLTDTVDRQMGFYGLRDGRVAAFAVHRTPDPAMPSDVRAAVRETYGGLGWLVPEALEHCPPSEHIYYDQVAQIVMPEWSRGRVVLLGDACFAVSLIAGQGASLAIAGAYVLAKELAANPDVGQALVDWENRWRPIVAEKQKTGRSGARWFLPASAWQLLVRRAVLRMTRVPGVNRLVAATLVGKPTTLVKSLARS